MSKDPFDFTDLSDLPEDLQKKLHTDTNDRAVEYAEVVRKGAEAGIEELDINQIIAAATRMGMEPPTQQTVRGYLNKAVDLGLVVKPSRQTYGIGEIAATPAPKKAAPKKSTKKEDTGAPSKKDAVASTDPLADL